MNKIIIFLFTSLFIFVGSCYSQDNQLTVKEKRTGWKLLFNGQNLDGWTSVGKDTPPSFGWIVKNGVLWIQNDGNKRGGDIITREKYSNFDLKVDFCLTKGANSGIKYFFSKYENGGWLGLEYQLIDNDNHPDAKLGREGNRRLGSLYDVLAPSNTRSVLIGEWNHVRIISKGSIVTHYLNGKKILTFDRNSDAYKKACMLSKFKNCQPMFGSVSEGYILLQDHGDIVSFKNIKIRSLK